jgi:hypothetical protein
VGAPRGFVKFFTWTYTYLNRTSSITSFMYLRMEIKLGRILENVGWWRNSGDKSRVSFGYSKVKRKGLSIKRVYLYISLEMGRYKYEVKHYIVTLLLPKITFFQLSDSSIYVVLYPTLIVP